MNITILLIIFCVLAVAAVVLIYLVWKFSRSDGTSGPMPVSAPISTPVPRHDPAPNPAADQIPPITTFVSPTPVRNHPGGEQDFFDIRGTRPSDIWICPVCGAENSSTTRCQICAAVRK